VTGAPVSPLDGHPEPSTSWARTTSRRPALWAAAAFVVLGIFLRIFRFWSSGLWTDEYGTWWVVADGGWADVVHRSVEIHGQSPFYYLIVKLCARVLGTGAFGLRLPSIVFGIATLALAYPLGLALFRQRYAGVFAAAVFAVSVPLIWYSQEARPYALALFMTALSFLCYARLLDKPGSWPWRTGYVLAVVGAFYAHYIFAFVLVIQMLHLLVTRGRACLRSWQWPLTLPAVALLCLPAAPYLMHLVARRGVLDWVPPLTWFTLVHLVVAFLDVPLLVVLAACLLVIGIRRGGPSPFDSASTSLLLVWIALPIVVFAGAARLVGVNLLFDRYVLFILPAGLLLATGLASLARREGWRGAGPFAALLIFSLSWNLVPTVVRTGGFGDRYDEDWAGAVASMESAAGPDDLVLYGTAFAEADQLRRPDLDPRIVSFIQAPVTANLRAGRRYAMLGLPFRVNEETRPYLRALMAHAAERRRVVIIGLGEAVPVVARALVQSGAWSASALTRHGLVAVIVLDHQRA